MYIMLSIEATVYADSNDKYSSIFQISKKKKLGLLSELKYSVKYLHVFLEFGTRGVLSTKVSCPVTDLACREASVCPTLEGCIESKRSIGQGGVRKKKVSYIVFFFFF